MSTTPISLNNVLGYVKAFRTLPNSNTLSFALSFDNLERSRAFLVEYLNLDLLFRFLVIVVGMVHLPHSSVQSPCKTSEPPKKWMSVGRTHFLISESSAEWCPSLLPLSLDAWYLSSLIAFQFVWLPICPLYNDLKGHCLILSRYDQFELVPIFMTDLSTCDGTTLIIPCGGLSTAILWST
jgi:hypothetical protein